MSPVAFLWQGVELPRKGQYIAGAFQEPRARPGVESQVNRTMFAGQPVDIGDIMRGVEIDPVQPWNPRMAKP
jgi:hypothetical protein